MISLRDEGTFGVRIRELGVPVHALKMNTRIPAPKVLAQLRQCVRCFQPDVIQGWMYHGNIATNLAGMFSPKRPAVVWNVRHSLYALADEKPLTRLVIRANRWQSGNPDAIIYNSRVSREQHEAFGFCSTKGRVIPNGFDVERLKPDALLCTEVRREFGIPESAVVIGHVARFHPMKGHAPFLHAAEQVAREHQSVRFLVVGRDVSPHNPALAGIVPPELLGRFVFPGERPDVYRLMQALDVLVMSSKWGEGFPNVLGEAMACGVPCVTTDIGDSSDIVGSTGVVAPSPNSEALAQGMLAVLSKTPEELQALGLAARERVLARYGLDSVVMQYGELYEEVAS